MASYKMQLGTALTAWSTLLRKSGEPALAVDAVREVSNCTRRSVRETAPVRPCPTNCGWITWNRRRAMRP